MSRSWKVALACAAGLAALLFVGDALVPKEPGVVRVDLSGAQLVLAVVGIMAVGVAIGRKWPRG